MFREGVFLSLWEANRMTEWGTEALKKCIFSLYPKGVDVWILVPMGIWNEIKKRNADQNHILSLIYRKALDMFDELLHRNDVFLTEKSITRHFPFMSHTWSIMWFVVFLTLPWRQWFLIHTDLQPAFSVRSSRPSAAASLELRAQRLVKLPSPGWLTADIYWTKTLFMSAPREEIKSVCLCEADCYMQIWLLS